MKRILKKSFKKVYILIFTYIFRIFPVKNNKIMFWNFFGKGYGCNSKYICEYILKNNLNFELFWVVRNKKYEFPNGITSVKLYSLSYFYHLATSKIFIDNQHKDLNFKKRNHQYLIKTWHATLGLKKIGLDNPSMDKNYVKMLDYNNKITNLMISNCDYIDSKFRRVFNYQGEFLHSGFPRTDIFFETDKINVIKKKLNIDFEQKILLYAPTFRENYVTEYYDVDFDEILNTLSKTFSGDWIVLIKLHPHLSDKKLNYKNNKIKDISKYDDIQELLLISDILITDYSNIMFEFGTMKKPVFLYASDYEQYKKDRDYYFDYNELPFYVAFNNDELNNAIKVFDQKKYNKQLEEFYGKLNFKDCSNSSEIIVNELIKVCKL